MAESVEQQVEELFRARTVDQIREVEVQARHEVEEKREQLRQLIGGSYRELLATSDAVIDIHESAKQVVGLVSRIQSQMQAVAEAVGKSNADNRLASPTSKSSTERLYDVGIRVKFLLDTPEHVWGCLDACDFLGAACRFLAASDAHRALTGRGKHGVAAQFPLLQHQWPLVRKFRGEVQGRAGEWLRDGAGAGDVLARDVAATLAALALLKPVDGQELLRVLLAARRGAVERILRRPPPATPREGTATLAAAAALVASTVATAAQLFCVLPGVTRTPLVQRALRRAPPPGPGADAAASRADWLGHAEAAGARLATLGAGGVALELGTWLDEVAGCWASGAPRGAMQAARSGRELAELEAGVRASLAAWACELDSFGKESDSEAGPTSAPAPAPRDPRPVPLSWDDVCQWALGAPRPLWPLLLEDQLVARACALVDGDVRDVVVGVGAALGAALEATGSLPPPQAGDRGATPWTQAVDLHMGSAEPSAAAPDVWLAAAAASARLMDEGLAHAAHAARDVCGAEGRAAALEPFLRRRLAGAAGEVADGLGAALAGLRERGGRDVHAALVIGHVAGALATRRGGPVQDGAGPGVGAGGAQADVEGLRSVQAKLGSMAEEAFEVWADWAAECIAAAFGAELAADPALAAPRPQRGWRPAALPGADGGAQGFELPFAPSPATLRALCCAAREVDRAGGAALGPAPRDAFEARLAAALAAEVLAAVGGGGEGRADAGTRPSPRLSEPGALQLAFDVRLAAAALGQGAASAAARGPSAATTATRHHAAAPSGPWAAAERAVAARLDPIDWASALPHLAAGAAAALTRSRLLVGLLSGGARAAGTPAPAGSESDDAVGVLRVAPAAPRCALLPVSTPPPAAVPRSLAAENDTGPDEAAEPRCPLFDADGGGGAHYGFAALRAALQARAHKEERPAGRGGGRGAAAAQAPGPKEMGAAAMDALRGSKLGALLGDRAAEMTASLGDMSFGTGLLSSLTGGLRR
ncbi:COG1 [Auxenochlorella protothecoides x Auxenochlorella symbiontica]